MLLGRQGRLSETAKGAMKGFKAAQGAGEHLRAAYCLTSLSETRRKSSGISKKAPGRWPKDMLLGRQGRNEGRQGRHEGFKGSSGRRGLLRAAYCLTSLSETRRKSPGKRPAGGQKTCC